MNPVGFELGNDSVSEGRDIPWLQDTDADGDGASDNFLTSWPFVYRDVVIVDQNNIAVESFSLTLHSLEEPDSYAELRRQFLDVPVEGYAEAGAAIFAMDFDGRIGAIDLPVMIIAGEHDIATTPERMMLYRDGIPGARMDTVPNAGHMPYVEEADAFNAILAGFLDAQPTG